MLFKIKETGEIKEVTYRPELEDLMPGICGQNKCLSGIGGMDDE